MKQLARQNWRAYIIIVIALGTVVAGLKLVTGVNNTTVALTLLLVVLVAASTYGLGPAIFASAAGMLCFNFFFLPPIGAFTIQDPQNWVALLAFLVTAIIASQLSDKARQRTLEAERGREEVWKLYQLSRAIIVTPDSETAVSSIARQVVEVFGFTYCAVIAPEAGKWKALATAGASHNDVLDGSSQMLIAAAFQSGELNFGNRHSSSKPNVGKDGSRLLVVYAPLKMGVRSIGVMVIEHDQAESGTLEAIAGLVALALERARFLQEISHTEALRQSDELKSALLASVSHDLRTPLTSIRIASDSLMQEEIDWDKASLAEFHQIISEEVNRLTHLVQNLLEMARIEAGELNPSKQWGAVSEILANVIERCAPSLRHHRIVVESGGPLASNNMLTELLVKVDSRLIAEALTNLVENAAKYSPDGSEIRLKVDLTDNILTISVIDCGPGIAPDEVPHIFDKFYRGANSLQKHEGTGMGLAIARGIIAAHGGKIQVESRLGAGTTFNIVLPVERQIAAAGAAMANEL